MTPHIICNNHDTEVPAGTPLPLAAQAVYWTTDPPSIPLPSFCFTPRFPTSASRGPTSYLHTKKEMIITS